MSSMSERWSELEDKECRQGFVEAQVDVDVPFQIAALAKARGKSPAEIAKEAGVSLRQLNGKARIGTDALLKLALYFDCAVIVKFAPFSEALRWEEAFRPSTFKVPSFEEEKGAKAAEEEWSKGMKEHLAFIVAESDLFHVSGVPHHSSRKTSRRIATFWESIETALNDDPAVNLTQLY